MMFDRSRFYDINDVCGAKSQEIFLSPSFLNLFFSSWFSFSTLHGSWITKISVLKSRSSVLPASDREHFELLLVSYSQSAHFKLLEKQEVTAAQLAHKTKDEIQEVTVGPAAAAQETSTDAAVAAVLSLVDGIFTSKAEQNVEAVKMFSLLLTGFGKSLSKRCGVSWPDTERWHVSSVTPLHQ